MAHCGTLSQRRHGLTLIELLVAVGLLALLAAQVVPTSSSLDVERLAAATTELRTSLRLARSLAMQKQTTVVVDLRVSNDISLLDGNCTNPGALLTRPMSGEPYRVSLGSLPGLGALQTKPDTSVTNGAKWDGLVFDALGQPQSYCNLNARSTLSPKQPIGQIQLNVGTQQAVVRIQTSNGRVWSE